MSDWLLIQKLRPEGLRHGLRVAGGTLVSSSQILCIVPSGWQSGLGHAYGNTPARTFATDRPDLVRGVILIAASGRAPMSDSVQRAITKSSDLTLSRDERLKYLAEAYFRTGA